MARICGVPFGKIWLADEEDVDRYLTEVKNAQIKEIAAGKTFRV